VAVDLLTQAGRANNEFLEKGSSVFVEREMRGETSEGTRNPRVWQGNDGEHRTCCELTVRAVKLLGRGGWAVGREWNADAPIGEPPPVEYESDSVHF
jgi:hypothetical protein